ncbi:hypothetical protein BKA60DRAFT_59425 [Fusarium oxysporum]|nr:hypothetical protein BKA60DRAFT_59425 [Fusarium oxysporum]
MSAPIASAHLRVARPTNNIDALLPFYVNGLGFKKIGEFRDHDGFDGLMLGHEGAGYHLEFTAKRGHDAGRSPTQDNLMIFYLPKKEEFDDAIARMEKAALFLSQALIRIGISAERLLRTLMGIEWCWQI